MLTMSPVGRIYQHPSAGYHGQAAAAAQYCDYYWQQQQQLAALYGQQHPAPQPRPLFSIDVECVATGTDHNSRSVAQISLVDEYERVILNVYVKPDRPVASYLSPLTGLNRHTLESKGVPLAEAMRILKECLPRSAVLVGQSIGKDVEWLGLREGVDFESLIDLAGLYKVWNSVYNTYSIFSLEHLARVVLRYDGKGQPHNAARDAVLSMQLYNYYRRAEWTPGLWEKVGRALLEEPVRPSFKKLNPIFEGVCMGDRKQCKCGAPFFG